VLTAMYERMLLAIEQGGGDMQAFMDKQETLIRDQVAKPTRAQ
jgi:DNA topoisomerase-3